MAYFDDDHYKLLNELTGAVYHEIDAEQQRVYETRGQAYDVAKRWAEALPQPDFKNGRSWTVCKAVNRSGKVAAYNRARLYPEETSHKGLGCTVGIDAALAFVVKIDLVEVQVAESAVRMDDWQIRSGFTPSPIVAVESLPDCTAMDLTGLVEWSADAIQ